MFGPLLVVLLQIQLHLVSALFTVEVLQPRYSAEHGSTVTMGCRFPVHNPFSLTNLSVLWQRKPSRGNEVKEVYKLSKGQEDLRQQHTDYQGRATVVRNKLKMGLSMLCINNVKIADAGIYVCLVHYEGADLKYIYLDVKAPYKKIHFQKRKEKAELSLTCQSQGYPLAEVSWQNEESTNLSGLAFTTHQITEDGLFNITSTLRVKPGNHGNYSCAFWNRELNENTSAHGAVLSLDFADKSTMEKNPLIVLLPICLLVVLVLTTFIFTKLRKKQFTNWYTQKGERRRRNQLSRKEDLDLQTKNLNAANPV
ncbi:programmed cell death 1 ligand 1 isoform X1 [Anolis sagrei]|uniref:programmed cell death 1 ligand 1 isoform X1 n=1 Tax=Anolis sagrei TaxID=38937 RepID=UPI003520C844